MEEAQKVCAQLRNLAKTKDPSGVIRGTCISKTHGDEHDLLVNADVMVNRADHLYDTMKFPEALAQYKVLVQELERNTVGSISKIMLQSIYYKMAKCYHLLCDYSESETEFKKSFKIIHEELKITEDPSSAGRSYWMGRLAYVTSDYGRMLSDKGNCDAGALEAYAQAMNLYADLIREFPSRERTENFRTNRANVLRHRAAHHDARQEWDAALVNFKECYEVYSAEHSVGHRMIAVVALEIGRVLLHSSIMSMRTRIPNGANVYIDGLIGAPHLNGSSGQVLHLDAYSGRYAVQTIGVTQVEAKLIRAQNLVNTDWDPGCNAVPRKRLVEAIECIRHALGIFASAHPTDPFRIGALCTEVEALKLIGSPAEALEKCKAALELHSQISFRSLAFLDNQVGKGRQSLKLNLDLLQNGPSSEALVLILDCEKTNGRIMDILSRKCGREATASLDKDGWRIQLFWSSTVKAHAKRPRP